MDDDWDLHAIVRGCATVNTTTDVTDDTFSNSPNFSMQNNDNSFNDFPCFFDDKNDSFIGLHEIYHEFCVDPPSKTNISTVSSTVNQVFRPREQIGQIQSLPQMNMQRQESVQLGNISSVPSPMNFPATNSQPVRQRRRKNQQMKMVHEMTQEEMAGDSWSWRKYGQKPIKGSPFPRNYYRCSTSKGCAARKQVERSANDPDIFVVAYTGEHTHPRPIHRSLLAGSTRNRLGQNKSTINNNANLSRPITHTSHASCSSFSSTTPAIEGQGTGQQNDDVDMMEEGDNEANEAENEEDDPNIMMINDMMNDDEVIFKRFQDFDKSSDQLLSPSWSPTYCTTDVTIFDIEGGD